MTLTYLQIDVRRQRNRNDTSRTLPGLFVSEKNQMKISMLREGTLGLGIVRSGNFSDYISSTELFRYQPGDLLVLLLQTAS